MCYTHSYKGIPLKGIPYKDFMKKILFTFSATTAFWAVVGYLSYKYFNFMILTESNVLAIREFISGREEMLQQLYYLLQQCKQGT